MPSRSIRTIWSKKASILGSDPNDAEPGDKMLYDVCRLADCSTPGNHLRYIVEVITYIVKAANAQPARTLNEMRDTFWMCLGFAPTFLRGGRETGDGESRVAQAIFSQVDPNAFAEALETFRPRELEGLARSFELIQEVERSFISKVAACVRTEKFFSATSDEWRLQSRELQAVLGVFAQGHDRQPARAWVGANQNVIEGPLETRLAWISPELAVSFYKAGRGLVLVAVNEPQWFETSLAMFEIMNFDRTVCAKIVEQHLPQLEAALYRLSLSPAHRNRILLSSAS
jgi:hypothetical protein